MDDNDRRRLIEFHVTPPIELAVEALRALIPQGDDIDAANTYLFLEPGTESLRAMLAIQRKGARLPESRELKLNKQQRAAFEFLLVIAAYHRSLIVQAWPNVERRSPKRSYAPDLPQYGSRALGMALEDLERKLRVEIWDLADEAGIRALKINA